MQMKKVSQNVSILEITSAPRHVGIRVDTAKSPASRRPQKKGPTS